MYRRHSPLHADNGDIRQYFSTVIALLGSSGEMMFDDISKQCCSGDISISVQTIVRERKLASPGEKEYLV